MLDLLPSEIWSDSSIKILDPACKSWVFLREAAKRFIKWLENEFPDLQERIDHIITKQLFWIGITNLTALLSRRSLYCSKNAKFDPNDDLWKYSICTKFKTNDWNVWFDRVEHERKNWNCIHCGASQWNYERDESLESYAYKFIHSDIKEIYSLFDLDPKMKFNVIIGNPPYQLQTKKGDEKSNNRQQAIPIYNKFIEQAKKLNPQYLTMIIPSRWLQWWMWLDDFRSVMLNDKGIKILHDFWNAKECFPWVEIKWWVCYFLRDNNYSWDCYITTHDNWKSVNAYRPLLQEWHDIFIRDNRAIPILNKIQWKCEKNITEIIEWLTAFSFPTNFSDYKDSEFSDSIKIYWNKFIWYIKKDQIKTGQSLIKKYKVLLPEAIWNGWFDLPLKPIVTDNNCCCTSTYMVIGCFDKKEEAENLKTYITTSFFKYLLWLRKITQHATKKVYQFIPLQDFSKSRTDEELYKKYNLSQEEIDYIETTIKPMD